MFGEGIQQLLSGTSFEDAILIAAQQWTMDLFEANKDKSFWNCFLALETFQRIRDTSILADYEVVIFNGKPACELSFRLTLPDGFYYRGYIDILMQNKLTGELLVVDAKTSGRKYSSSTMYQNSAQAIGYSIIIDAIRPEASGYQVLYYEYLTSMNKFVDHLFTKDYLERANWIRNIMIDIEGMKLYDSYPDWPMHGESCGGFGSWSCPYIDNCTMRTASLVGDKVIDVDAKELDRRNDELITYDIEVTLEQVIQAQLEKA
jgi:hypothetical protein